jgi:DNA polymerase III alpha subunit
LNTEKQLIEGILKHGVDILAKCQTSDDLSLYLKRIQDERLDYPIPLKNIDINKWNIPQEYRNIDIEDFLINQCPKENYDRLIKELELYRKNGMLDVLKSMKYIVDSLRTNNLVWGVGRGSSVASYVLFLLGVHKIDSVKYDIPIDEFFKGEK